MMFDTAFKPTRIISHSATIIAEFFYLNFPNLAQPELIN